MATFAKKTTVASERTRAEIESILARYGANQFGYFSEPGRAMIAFRVTTKEGVSLSVRMTLPLPAGSEERFTHPYKRQSWKAATAEVAHAAWEQECRAVWRSLLLIVKAKLEAVSAGISTIEREFMADVLLPSGLTMSESILPQLPEVYRTGGTPMLMLTNGPAQEKP